jgi:uncharacterized membrane protein
MEPDMTIKLTLLATLTLSLLVVSCKDEEELPEVDCSGDVPVYADVAAFDKCTMCHSSELSGADRRSSPATINFDTFEGAEMQATLAAQEVKEGAMPPSGSGITLTADEKDELYRWALCGAME